MYGHAVQCTCSEATAAGEEPLPVEDGIGMMLPKQFIWPSCEDPAGELSMNCPARLRADYAVIEHSAEGAP